MELSKYFKGMVDNDTDHVIICDLDNTVIYLNKMAEKRYGKDLLGKNIKDCHNDNSKIIIDKVLNWFKESKNNNIYFEKHNDIKNTDNYMVAIRDENDNLIGYYEKHCDRNLEKIGG